MPLYRHQGERQGAEKIQKLFKATAAAMRGDRVIAAIHEKFGYLIDPHTAVGFSRQPVPGGDRDETAAITVASTASPFKFCTDVLDALGCLTGPRPGRADQLSQVTGEPVPPLCRAAEQGVLLPPDGGRSTWWTPLGMLSKEALWPCTPLGTPSLAGQ